MKFKSRTEEEIQRDNLLADGRYPFTVASAEEKTDKNGAGFFKLKLLVHSERDWVVFDNVSPEWMAHKLLHFCEATGLANQYQRGELLASDMTAREGFCQVTSEPASGNYAAKNTIADYLSAQEVRREEKPAAAPKMAQSKDPFADDFVP